MNWRVKTTFFVLLALNLFIGAASAQEDEDNLPGLRGRYTVSGRTIERVDPDIAFVWNSHSPDPRLPKGEFQVEWTGRLLIREAVDFQFHAYVAGAVAIEVDGRTVLAGESNRAGWISGESTKLRFGERELKIRYRKTGDDARISLYWSSNAFPVEPIPYFLLFRDGGGSQSTLIEQGRQSFESHRCNRCHVRNVESPSLPAPSLTHVRGGVDANWLVSQISNPGQATPHSKMPSFGFTFEQARDIAAFLLASSQNAEIAPFPEAPAPAATNDGSTPATASDERREGELLFRTVGCLACHRVSELGNEGFYSGGNLTRIGGKRSAEWIAQWLAEPKKLNADHAMPVFKLDDRERRILAIYLSSLRGEKQETAHNVATNESIDSKAVERGRELVKAARCAACHRIGDEKVELSRVPDLSLEIADIKQSCLAASADSSRWRPAYGELNREALVAYIQSRVGTRSVSSQFELGARLLETRNCLACHERGVSKGLAGTAAEVLQTEEQLKGQSQTLIPPALTAVGDKLIDRALSDAVGGDQNKTRLPWLRVRMPRFAHSPDEQAALLAYLIGHDRIPDGAPAQSSVVTSAQEKDSAPPMQMLLDGQSLVGHKGFVCIACHELGEYAPRNVALGTRGSNLLRIGERMRKSYYMRWTRAPLRVVPGMEMPSYSRALPGLFDGNIDAQLAATWDALNDVRFVPPTYPAAVEQHFAVERGERPRIVRDVFTNPDPNGGGSIPRAFAVGFDNGHSLLFDLDRAAVRRWTFGDFASQRSQGKSWFWDMAGVLLVKNFGDGADLGLLISDSQSMKERSPRVDFGTSAKLIDYRVAKDEQGDFVELKYTLRFEQAGKSWQFDVNENLRPVVEGSTATKASDPTMPDKSSGLRRQISVTMHSVVAAKAGEKASDDVEFIDPPWLIVYRPTVDSQLEPVVIDCVEPASETVDWLADVPAHRETAFIRFSKPNLPGERPSCRVTFEYRSLLKRSPLVLNPAAPLPSPKIENITSLPGFNGVRLPIDKKIMPTAITWTSDGTLAFASLRGDVYLARDTDGDGIEDRLSLFEEGLAAPYGIIADRNDLIVAHKPELLRLRDTDGDGRADERTVIASGWGYTENYHDWTTGIVRDRANNLFVGLGSDYTQGKRPQDVARWRGKVLRIDPQGEITPIGHAFRYPTGLAIDQRGRIFVSDNQGEQNTFNEINHLVEGGHYGVPSRWEEETSSPEVPPAIRIPHPWTRSVNGLFFLTEKCGAELAGQGIGCEYDSRFLMRFSVQEVDGVVQGAAYYFSRPNAGTGSDNFVGPLCGAVAPNGDIYVGSVWDSGWQGGQNTGEIVRLRRAGSLPNGIREVRATHDGFEIEYFAPVSVEAASNVASYSISGYTREWKGGYSTPDSGRHAVELHSASVSADQRTVRLHLASLREGYVYEVNCAGVANDLGSPLWPDTGHYTLHRVPHERSLK